jgi:hypothetical protein
VPGEISEKVKILAPSGILSVQTEKLRRYLKLKRRPEPDHARNISYTDAVRIHLNWVGAEAKRALYALARLLY